jgi:ferredoxin-fold anticodon binding domain-containing protein
MKNMETSKITFTIGETVWFASHGKTFGVIEKITPTAVILKSHGHTIRRKLSEIRKVDQPSWGEDKDLLYESGSCSPTFEDEPPTWR